jgi:hypothetical protein
VRNVFTAITSLVFLVSLGAHAAEQLPGRAPIDIASLGPQVGESVPDFNLPDQNGQIRNLESVLGPNGAILLFHRSADW